MNSIKTAHRMGITLEMIQAARKVFLAKAHEDLVRPIVEGYEDRILHENKFKFARQYERFGHNGRVLERQLTYLMDEVDYAKYLALTFQARDEAKLMVSHPENCPLLEAQSARTKAEAQLLKAVGQHPKLRSIDGGIWNLDLRKKAVDLCLNLVAPFVGESDEELAWVMAA